MASRPLVLVLVLVLVAGVLPLARAETPATEYEVKAAFLFNFAKYVEWPSAAHARKGDAIIIGVFGDDPFGRSLDDAVEGKTVGGRPLLVRRVKRLEETPRCHIVFVSSAEDDRLAQVLRTVAGENVLVVGESPRFAERGGAIGFRDDGGRVRFDINPDAAERAGLRVSSQLLKLARIVRDGGR